MTQFQTHHMYHQDKDVEQGLSERGKNCCLLSGISLTSDLDYVPPPPTPGWLRGERVGLMTWWL